MSRSKPKPEDSGDEDEDLLPALSPDSPNLDRRALDIHRCSSNSLIDNDDEGKIVIENEALLTGQPRTTT